MELKEGTIREIQEHVAHKVKERGFDDEPLHERLLLLTEEVGELVKACRKAMNMHVKDEKHHNIEEELADVLNMLFAVADVLEIDLEKAHKEKEMELDKRTYKRAKK